MRLCGVEDEVIAWEYGLTEKGLGDWGRIIVERMMRSEALSSERLTMEQAERVVGSRASNMTAWLTQVLDGEFGGARKYLKDHCGFEDGDLDRIRGNLVVEGEAVVPPKGWNEKMESGGMGLAKDEAGMREEKVMIA